MSDLEHEMIVEQVQTQRDADEMRRLARRALAAAESAQEAAYGRHDPWIDTAMRMTMRVTTRVT
jgi:type II secretory pathway pseudopilin PulG